MRDAMKTALYMGRFQPFHRGHLHVVKRLSGRYRKVIIAIGSSQHSRTKDNPFSLAERRRMITLAMKETGIKNYVIVAVPDIGEHGKWVEWTISKCPKFQEVYSGNAFVRSLFKKAGYSSKPVKLVNGFSATKVRNIIIKNGKWEKLIPDSIADYMKKRKLDTVIRRIKI